MTDIVVATARLVVRRFRTDDAAALHAYRNDPETARWQGWDLPYSRAAADELTATMATVELFRRGDWTQLAVERRDTPGLVGDIGVRVEPEEPTAEVGITFAPEHRGQGYASEALGAVVDHLLGTRGFVRVVAFTASENTRTQRLLERVGLRAVAVDGDDLVYLLRLTGEAEPTP